MNAPSACQLIAEAAKALRYCRKEGLLIERGWDKNGVPQYCVSPVCGSEQADLTSMLRTN